MLFIPWSSHHCCALPTFQNSHPPQNRRPQSRQSPTRCCQLHAPLLLASAPPARCLASASRVGRGQQRDPHTFNRTGGYPVLSSSYPAPGNQGYTAMTCGSSPVTHNPNGYTVKAGTYRRREAHMPRNNTCGYVCTIQESFWSTQHTGRCSTLRVTLQLKHLAKHVSHKYRRTARPRLRNAEVVDKH